MAKASATTETVDRLLSRKDLKDIFQVDTSTLRRWEMWGLLRPLRLGHRTIRYRLRDVERAIREAEEGGGAGGGADTGRE